MIWMCEKGRGGELGEMRVGGRATASGKAGFSLEAGNRRTPAATFDISTAYFCQSIYCILNGLNSIQFSV